VEDGIVLEVRFNGGCNGNTQGVAALCKGMPVDEVITRLSGINSLAFRLPQNNRFFMIDADCPAFTPKVSAEMNLRFMEAAALSGSVLIASITPGLLTEAEKKRARKAFQTAASGKSTK